MPHGTPLKFDLATGQVRTGEGERMALIPLSTLDELAQSAGPDAAARFARSVGLAMGRRVAAKLGSSRGVEAASLEGFVTELAMEVGLSGWGSLSLERWGRALVLLVDHPAVKERAIVAALVEGAVEAAAGREVHAAPLSGDGPVRVMIANRATAERARVWTAQGVAAAEVMARLHASAHVRAGEGSP